jgi:hypothetical protein
MLIRFPQRSDRPLSYLLTKFRCALCARMPQDVSAWETVIDLIEDGVELAEGRLLDRGEATLLRRLRRKGGSGSLRVGEVFGGELLARYLHDFAADIAATTKDRASQHLTAASRVMEQLRRWLIRMGYSALVESPAERASRAHAAAEAVPRARQVAALLRGIQVRNHAGGRNGHFHYGGPLAVAKVAREKLWLEQGVAEDLLGPIDIPPESISDGEVDWEIDGALCRGPQGCRLMDVRAVSPLGLLTYPPPTLSLPTFLEPR